MDVDAENYNLLLQHKLKENALHPTIKLSHAFICNVSIYDTPIHIIVELLAFEKRRGNIMCSNSIVVGGTIQKKALFIIYEITKA